MVLAVTCSMPISKQDYELTNGQAPITEMPITPMLLDKIGGKKPMLAYSTTVGQFMLLRFQN